MGYLAVVAIGQGKTAGFADVTTVIHLAVFLLAASFRMFMSDPKRERSVRRGLSLTFGAFALWFGWSTMR